MHGTTCTMKKAVGAPPSGGAPTNHKSEPARNQKPNWAAVSFKVSAERFSAASS